LDGIKDSLVDHTGAQKQTDESLQRILVGSKPQASINILIDQALLAIKQGISSPQQESNYERPMVVESRESLQYQPVLPNPSSLIYSKEGKSSNGDVLHPMHYQFNIPNASDILKKVPAIVYILKD
jgi:hypothetical protein